jgi:hypothetical protein
MTTTAVSIGFSKSRSIGSKLIRFFTRSNVSHTFFIIKNSFLDTDMILEAVPAGFHLISLEAFAKKHEIVYIVPLPQIEAVALRKAISWLGRRYDYLGVVGVLVVLFGHLFKLKWRNPFNTKAMFCSEALVRLLQFINYPKADTLDPSAVTPISLYRFLKAKTS